MCVRCKTLADLNNQRMATNSNIKQHMATYSIIQQHIFYIVVSNYCLFLENLEFRRSSALKGAPNFSLNRSRAQVGPSEIL